MRSFLKRGHPRIFTLITPLDRQGTPRVRRCHSESGRIPRNHPSGELADFENGNTPLKATETRGASLASLYRGARRFSKREHTFVSH